MSTNDFIFLLESIRDQISKNDTNFQKAVTAEERLAITLRYLATGDSFTSLQYVFKVSKQLISKIIQEVCSFSPTRTSKTVNFFLRKSISSWKIVLISRQASSYFTILEYNLWSFFHRMGRFSYSLIKLSIFSLSQVIVVIWKHKY